MSPVRKQDGESQAANREEMLQLAINAAKRGNHESARVMLRTILEEDKRNERALMWMAKLAESKNERRQWLERVILVNPNQFAAKEALRKMEYSSSARDNRVLVIFGVVAGVLIVLAVVLILWLNQGGL